MKRGALNCPSSYKIKSLDVNRKIEPKNRDRNSPFCGDI